MLDWLAFPRPCIGRDVLIVEAQNCVGGKARSEVIDGFTFDVTGHWLHLRDPEIRSLILDLMGADHFMSVSRMSRVCRMAYTRYPPGQYLWIARRCGEGMPDGAIEADRQRGDRIDVDSEPESFSEWIRLYFGEGTRHHDSLQREAVGVSRRNHQPMGTCASSSVGRDRRRCSDAMTGMGYNAPFLYLSGRYPDCTKRLRMRWDEKILQLAGYQGRFDNKGRPRWTDDSVRQSGEHFATACVHRFTAACPTSGSSTR